jgi:hypothetical protein
MGGSDGAGAIGASGRDEDLDEDRLLDAANFLPNLFAQVRRPLRDHHHVLNQRRKLHARRDAKVADVGDVSVGDNQCGHFVHAVAFRQSALVVYVVDVRFQQGRQLRQFLHQLLRLLAKLARLAPRRPDKTWLLREQD